MELKVRQVLGIFTLGYAFGLVSGNFRSTLPFWASGGIGLLGLAIAWYVVSKLELAQNGHNASGGSE